MGNQFDLVVVGGGPAGVTAALRACELGASVALVERDRMGGTCTNDGCAPTRVLAKAARLVRDAEQYEAYGLYGPAPTVNLAELLERTQEKIYRLHEKKQLLENLRQAGCAVFAEVGPARFSDPHTLALANGDTVSAGQFILCVGGHARRLNFPGSEFALTHSDVWSLETMPSSVAIIGGAATGCQLASIFAAFGADVTILDIAPQILGAEDALVAETMAAAFRARGVQVLAGVEGVDNIESHGDMVDLVYRDEGDSARLRVDKVILAVGWVGNVETLALENAGVIHDRGYVQVDDTLRTSASHVYAAGDVTGRMMLVQSATHEARVAAENAILGQKRDFRHYVVPHGGFTDPEYAGVGLTEAEAATQGPIATAVVPYADLDRAVIDDRQEGFCKLVVSRTTNQLLGAHVVGEDAVEVVQIAAAGMAAGMTVAQLAELEIAYPTYTAVMGLAARQIVRTLGLTPLAQQWRTLRRLDGRTAEWERRDAAAP